MAISIVQTVQGGGSGISGTLNITVASTAAGNCLIVIIGNNASNVVPSAVTLGGTNLTNDASKTDAGANAAVSFWSLPNIASGQTAVAITHAATWSPGVTVIEVSGLATASVFDTANAGGASSAGSQSTFDSGSTTTNQAVELWLGCCVTFGTSGHTTITPTGTGTWSAFSNITQGSFTDVLGADQIVSSTGTLRYTGTLSPSAADWVAQAAAYMGASAAIPPPLPQQARSYPGWQPQQRDRRDANTVATAANPLVSPLDTAWQADAAYWHLYNDGARRDSRSYFQQRSLVSDPALLSAVPADPLALNPEQSNSSDLWRAAIVPAFYDRREVPQQRQYYDVSLLATALLENELLGGSGTAQRYGAPAYCDRREVPQQRIYYPPPSPFLLENELLGGAGTIWHAWWQRPGSWPQQRLYISDPSFYPAGAATDPLTVAWGVGGPYWHLYNRAADATDRREVPQQRAYVSDPLLLTTAELENELLGGAGTAQRYGWPAYCDRREVPQQRAPVALVSPPVPFDPLLAAWADLARRYGLAATHADRRLYPQQRLYFPVPLPPPPFTIGTLTASDAALGALTAVTAAGGSGGVLTATDQRTGGPA